MQNPTLLTKSDIRPGCVELWRVSKVSFELAAELAGALVVKFVRDRFGGIPVLNHVASEPHPQRLHPLLRCFFELCKEETFQLPLGDEALAGEVLAFVSCSACKSRPVGDLREVAAHILNTCETDRFFQRSRKSYPQPRGRHPVRRFRFGNLLRAVTQGTSITFSTRTICTRLPYGIPPQR